jgi:hypothetical protein
MGVGHTQPDLNNLGTDVPSQMISAGLYLSDHEGVSFQVIAEAILDSAAADITFTNIPQNYRNLFVQLMTRSDTAATFTSQFLQFNADTATNYDSQTIKGNATTASASQSTGSVRMNLSLTCGDTAPADTSGFTSLWIFDYARTTWRKGVLGFAGTKTVDAAGGINAEVVAGFYDLTDAVTSLKFFPQAGNYMAGTVITLWGMA